MAPPARISVEDFTSARNGGPSIRDSSPSGSSIRENLRELFKPAPQQKFAVVETVSVEEGRARNPSRAIALAVHAGLGDFDFFPGSLSAPQANELPASKCHPELFPLDISEFAVQAPAGQSTCQMVAAVSGDHSPLPATKGQLPEIHDDSAGAPFSSARKRSLCWSLKQV